MTTYVGQNDLPTVTEQTLFFWDKFITHMAMTRMHSQPREIIKKFIDQKYFYLTEYIPIASGP